MTARVMNERDKFVIEALEGFELANHELVRLHRDPVFLTRRVPKQGRVALVSGGGSGHEPLHTGFVGVGMLDAAVPGAVFSSPTSLQVKAAIDEADAGAGVLLIVKNYTGDVLNFSIAADLANSRRVEVLIVDDDLATAGSPEAGPGRRGTAAVVAVEKICGAAAERGDDLSAIAELGRGIVRRSATLSVAFQACTNPMTGLPSFELGSDQVEFGVGIHGERGVETRPAAPARELMASLVDPLAEHLALKQGNAVIAIINSLGASPGLETAVAAREVYRLLGDRGVQVARTLVGSFVTALDMKGVSVTLTEVTEEHLELWDAPARTSALRW